MIWSPAGLSPHPGRNVAQIWTVRFAYYPNIWLHFTIIHALQLTSSQQNYTRMIQSTIDPGSIHRLIT